MPTIKGVIKTLIPPGSRFEDQLVWLESSDLCSLPAERKHALFDFYVQGLNHVHRRQMIKILNEKMKDNFLENHIFPDFLSHCPLSYLTACVDGPSNSVVTTRFADWMELHRQHVVENLIRMLAGWTGREQTELLQIARLIQSIGTREAVGSMSQEVQFVLRESLLGILETCHGDSSRDLISVVGYLACMHFPDERTDRAHWQAMARMSVYRGIIVLTTIDLAESITFFESFMVRQDSAISVQDLHYAIQSLQLLLGKCKSQKIQLTKENGIRVLDLCLSRWEHSLHMISANCRSLFGQICSLASPELLDEILTHSSMERGSKKKFNLLFGLVGYVGVEKLMAAHADIVDEILNCIRKWSPAVTAASGLLAELVKRSSTESAKCIHASIGKYLKSLEGEAVFDFDYDQLLGCVAGPRLISELCSSDLDEHILLRVLYFVVESKNVTLSESGDILMDTLKLISLDRLGKLVISCDPTVASAALSVALKSASKWPHTSTLVRDFITEGGIVTVSSSNDDRSLVLQEMKRFFDKAKMDEIKCWLIELVIQESLRSGTIQEESLLGIEVLASLREGRLAALCDAQSLANKLVSVGLASRWRKVRIAARSILTTALITCSFPCDLLGTMLTDQSNEELAGCVLDLSLAHGLDLNNLVSRILQSPIDSPRTALLTAIANCNHCFELSGLEVRTFISFLLGVVVHHSQFVGVDCVDAVLSNSGTLLRGAENFLREKKFTGTVDCRGHPIVGSDEESSRISVKAWTAARAAILALRKLCSPSLALDDLTALAKSLAILLLSVKHPAEIAPLESVFGSVLALLPSSVVDEELLIPLVGSVTGVTAGVIFPLPLALRRSQGLGPLISSIIRSQSSMAVLKAVVERLVSVVNLAQEETDQALHSLNVLRALARDSSIPDELMNGVIGDMMIAGLDILFRLSDDYWRVRSSATQLFVQAARRFIGSDNEDNGLGRSQKKITANEFFFNRGGDKLMSEMIGVLSNVESEFGIVPVLSVLQSLTHFGDLRDGSVLIEKITNLIQNESVHVRRLSAKIVSRLPHARFVIGDRWNAIHGNLILASYLLDRGMVTSAEVQSRFAHLWERNSSLPEIVKDELIGVFVKAGLAVECNKTDLVRWIAALDSVTIKNVSLILQVVDLDMQLAAQPVIRELVVECLSHFPWKVPQSMREALWSIWFESKFDLGLSTLFSEIESSEVESWIQSLDILQEDCDERLKKNLGESEIVRSRFVDLHAKLLLDESPNVRQSACIDGLNCISSFRLIVGNCSQHLLSELVNGPSSRRDDDITEYCVRASVRSIIESLQKE